MEPIEILKLLRYSSKQIEDDLNIIITNLSQINGYNVDSKFEYFYQSKHKNVKLLHLLFYKEDCSAQEKQKICLNRKRQMLSLFKFINKNNNFNFVALKRILNYTINPDYPIQFAIEFNERIEKIKIYFSNSIGGGKNNKNIINLAKELMKLLDIQDNLESSMFIGEGIDSLGIDFLDNRGVNLKIYTFFYSKFKLGKIKNAVKEQFRKYGVEGCYLKVVFKKIAKLDYSEWGFLYRISDHGTIKSVKFWYRIASSIDAPFKLNSRHQLKISYITCDRNGIGYYLRDSRKSLCNQDYLFKKITEKIAETDFTGYTIQYPPLMTWKPIDNRLISEWVNISPKDSIGLYIHIPFCKEKCTFCRYYSKKILTINEIQRFLDSFKREISLYEPYLRNRKFATLYIGGGTPTILDEFQLKYFFSLVNDNFIFMDNVQKCIEATPSTLNFERLKILKDFGINRLTLGIQTLTPRVLRNVNRYQPNIRTIARKIILQTRRIGIDKINIDIMAGLPGETVGSFVKTVKEIVGLLPDMIHIHPFYPTGYTRFIKEENSLSRQDMDLRDEMVNLSRDILISNGYKSIKLDAFGKDEKSRNIQLSDAIENISSYLGLGPGAVSHIRGRIRYVNFDNFERYISYLTKKQMPIMKGAILDEKDEMIYYVTACLRYGEVSKTTFLKLFNKRLDEVFKFEIKYLKERKLIIEKKDKIIPRFNNIGEYLIYSKYFYSTDLVNYFNEEYFVKQKEPIKEMDIKYILL